MKIHWENMVKMWGNVATRAHLKHAGDVWPFGENRLSRPRLEAGDY